MDHTYILLLSDSIHITPQQVFHLQTSHERQKIPPYLLLNEFFTISSGSNSCTYPPRIEHAGMVEKGRYSDRERGKGQPEARASPIKVEKEVKKTRGTSHPDKFEAKASDGHHRDYILLLFVGLTCKSALGCFLFFSF